MVSFTLSNIVIDSVVGPDGTLHLEVPIGMECANQAVRVMIEAAPKPMTPAEWATFVLSMAGSITDPTFERPPQLPVESRESLSSLVTHNTAEFSRVVGLAVEDWQVP